MKEIVAYLTVLSALLSQMAAADTFNCGWDSDRLASITSYPFSPIDSVRVKIVFVAFPLQDGQNVPNAINTETHCQIVREVRDYIKYQSNGNLRMTVDSGILYRPGHELNEGDPQDVETTWQVLLTPEEYRNCDSAFPSYYVPDDHHPTWWMGTSYLGSPIVAELFEQIMLEYAGQANPLDADLPNGEKPWALWIVYLSNQSPFDSCAQPPQPVGGRPGIQLHRTIVNQDTDGYFSDVDYGTFSSSQIADYNYINGEYILNIEHTAYYIVHEFAHNLGPADGPPALHLDPCGSDPDPVCEGRYFFGNLNLMGQSYVEDAEFGIPPIADPWLQMLPWNTTVEFNDKTFLDLKIYDIRKGGSIYRFNRPNTNAGEYFILAYHGADLDVSEEPYVGRGLAIWHCTANTMFDLESAVGLWDFAEAHATEFYYPEPNGTVPENSINGYDNYDFWEWGGGYSDGECRIWDDQDPLTYDVVHNRGCGYDFFGTTYVDENYLRKQLFAPWTNPSCKWYNENDGDDLYDRRRDQDQDNSLIVRITEEGIDENGPYVQVDLLPGPCPEMLTPLAGQIFSPLDECLISWTTEYAEYLTTADVFLSTNGGISYPYQINDAPIDVSGLSGTTWWTWDVPVANKYGTNDARIRVVFHNNLGDIAQGYTNSPGSFSIIGATVPYEVITAPSGGERWYEGRDYEIRWTNYWNLLDPDPSVTLFYSHDSGATWQLFGDIEYTRGSGSGENVAEIQVVPDMFGDSVLLKLEFTYNGATGFDVADAPITICPLGFALAEVEISVDVPAYNGHPSSSTTIDIDGNALPDLFVAIGESNNPNEPSHLYQNDSEDDALSFTDATGINFPINERPGIGFKSAETASVAAGEPDAIFLTHQEENAPRLYVVEQSDSKYHNKAQSQATEWFDPNQLQYLYPSTCAAWCDIDHDGDLDLYVGRGDIEQDIDYRDIIFENRGATATQRFQARTDLTFFEENVTRSILWSHIGPVGDAWSVFVGTSEGLVGYKQQENVWTFQNMNLQSTSSAIVDIVGGDYGREGLQQAATLREDGRIAVLTESYNYYQIASGAEGSYSVAAGDLNLDGFQDVAVSGDLVSSECRILLNTTESDQVRLTDIADVIGLDTGYGAAKGVTIADMDADGDQDLFVGRYGAEGRLYTNQPESGPGAPVHNWLGVDLGPAVPENPSSIGAVVTLRSTYPSLDTLGQQVVTTEGCRGYQQAGQVVFGLGNFDGTADLSVAWPSGATATVVGISNFNEFIEVSPDPATINLIDGSAGFVLVVGQGGQITWEFRWQTDQLSTANLDNVVVHLSGGSCGTQDLELFPGMTSGVTSRVEAFLSRSKLKFQHTLKWIGAPCYPNCSFTYDLYSSDGAGPCDPMDSDSHTGRMPKLCPASE